MQDLPAIGKIPLLDVLGEGNGSVAINRNVLCHVSADYQTEHNIATYGCRPIPLKRVRERIEWKCRIVPRSGCRAEDVQQGYLPR